MRAQACWLGVDPFTITNKAIENTIAVKSETREERFGIRAAGVEPKTPFGNRLNLKQFLQFDLQA